MDQIPFSDIDAWLSAHGLSLAQAASLCGVGYATARGWKRRGFVEARHADKVKAALADPAPSVAGFCKRAHAEALIAGLGGVAAVAERFDVSPSSVSSWKARGVPGDRVASLLAASNLDSRVSAALGANFPDRYSERRSRLADLVRQRFNGRQQSLAEASGIAPSYIANMLCDPRRKGHKRIGEAMVERIEARLSIPGWFAGVGAGLTESPAPNLDRAQATSVIALLPVLEMVRARLPLNEWEGLVQWFRSTAGH